MSARRTIAVLRKELLHIVRDIRSLAMALLMPLLLLLLFGFALSLDVDRIPTLIYDGDGSAASRALLERFQGSRFFDIRGYVSDYDVIRQEIDAGRALMAIAIPRKYGARIAAGDSVDVQILIDGSDSNTASIAKGYAESAVLLHSQQLRADVQNRRAGMRPVSPVDYRQRVLYNSSMKSRNYIVPGLIAVILMIIAALLTSLTIAREWEMGTMEQLLSTPLRPAEMVLGKMLAFFVLGAVDTIVAVVVGVAIFDVPLRGSLVFLALSSCVFLVGALFWGILISAIAKNQLLAFQMGILSSFLPSFLLSGFIYAVENMPVVIQLITYVIAPRHFVTILKGVFLKGVGIEILWPQLLFLLVYGTGVFAVATRKLAGKLACSMWQRIIEIFRKEIRTVFREPRMRIMLFVPPVLQLIIFGFAVNLDVDTVKVAWTDSDGSAASRELLSRFQGSGRFDVIATPKSGEELQRLLDHGAAQAGIRVLPGFSRDLKRGRSAGVQVLIDGTNSNTASLVASYASQILNAYSAEWTGDQMNMRLLARSASERNEFHLPEIVPETRVWFNPDLRSRYYFVPGVLVNIIMIVTVMLTALAIVREKEIGTMEQLMVTPIRPIELMIGKTLPFALVGLAQVVLITTVALLVFRVPFRGNALLLVLSSALFLMTTLGAGLFLSTISQTQQQAMMSMFFFTVPAFMLSGFAFPIANMPEAVQWLTFLNPARYFMEIVRGLFLKGAGMAALWPQMAALFVYGVSVLALSAARFRKKLD